MSTVSRDGFGRRVRNHLSFLGVVVVLHVAASSTAVGQPIPRDPSRRESAPLRTIPAPCELPAETVLRLEERFRSILLSWLAGQDGVRQLDSDWQRAVDQAAGFVVTDATVYRLPSSPSGRVIVPALGCHEKAEQQVLRLLAVRAPETIPALFAFYLQVYARQITPPPSRRWLASRARDRLVWLTIQQKQVVVGGRDERAARARMLLMLADVMQAAPFQTEILEARALLEDVVDLSPESVAARYMSATLAERTGDYEAAVFRLERLGKRVPDDTEVVLRTAINRARIGDDKAALRGLQTVARGSGPDWIRILAYQEWVRSAGERDDDQAILTEALAAFPGERQLSLQLAASLIEAGEWGEAETVLDRMTPTIREADDESVRLRYDVPRRDELEAEAARMVAEIEAGLEPLRRLLEVM